MDGPRGGVSAHIVNRRRGAEGAAQTAAAIHFPRTRVAMIDDPATKRMLRTTPERRPASREIRSRREFSFLLTLP